MKEIKFNKNDKIEIKNLSLNGWIATKINENFLILEKNEKNYFYLVKNNKMAIKQKLSPCFCYAQDQIKKFNITEKLNKLIKLIESNQFANYSQQIVKVLSPIFIEIIKTGIVKNNTIIQKEYKFFVKEENYQAKKNEKIRLNLNNNTLSIINDYAKNKEIITIKRNLDFFIEEIVSFFIDKR